MFPTWKLLIDPSMPLRRRVAERSFGISKIKVAVEYQNVCMSLGCVGGANDLELIYSIMGDSFVF
jgi:hypothetical protein